MAISSFNCESTPTFGLTYRNGDGNGAVLLAAGTFKRAHLAGVGDLPSRRGGGGVPLAPKKEYIVDWNFGFGGGDLK